MPRGAAIAATEDDLLSVGVADAVSDGIGDAESDGVAVELEEEPLDITIAPSAKMPTTTASTTRFELPDFLAATGVLAAGATFAAGLLSTTFVAGREDATGTGGTTILVVAARLAGDFFTALLVAFLAVFFTLFLAGDFFAAFLTTFLVAAFLATVFFFAGAFFATFFVATNYSLKY